jgi:hypothetical protein
VNNLYLISQLFRFSIAAFMLNLQILSVVCKMELGKLSLVNVLELRWQRAVQTSLILAHCFGDYALSNGSKTWLFHQFNNASRSLFQFFNLVLSVSM